MKQVPGLSCFIILLALTSCRTTRVSSKDDGKIDVVLIQVNDVYEIAPVSGGKEGGMARIATLKKQYQRSNPNTFMVMGGDFLSPSIYNSLQHNGKRVRGAQMVDAMNTAGMDFVCFGNHEFDINERELQDRLNESTFTWISSNAFHKVNNNIVPFTKSGSNAATVPASFIKTIKDADGTTAKIGFMGLVLPVNRADYVSYTNALTAAKEVYNRLKDSVDAIVAITHQDSADDKRLAQELPGLAAILGGHEHTGFLSKVGNVYISKGLSNARSAFVVTLTINKLKKDFSVQPRHINVTDSIPLDPATTAVVNKWGSIVQKSYDSLGFNINGVVLSSGEALDLREEVIYSAPSNFTRLVTQAMAYACPQADVVMFNAGSARLDDLLVPPVSQYDILRSMPYGGGIREADMKGSMLIQVLDSAQKNIRKGGWLHYQPVVRNATTHTYLTNNIALDPDKIYRVALTDFLLTGKEIRLDFLNDKNPGIVKLHPAETAPGNPKSDIRLAVVKYLMKK
jgi:2',3'-cyclic-nucleotide 2'-phosphodiesterase (5'-nucleotidase family)